mgnify:FL=1
MIMERRLWMVCYDISDTRRRKHVEQALQAFGERVQYSVFECFLTLPEARFHLARLAEDLDAECDTLRAYPLCRWCESAVNWQGPGQRNRDERVYLL